MRLSFVLDVRDIVFFLDLYVLDWAGILLDRKGDLQSAGEYAIFKFSDRDRFVVLHSAEFVSGKIFFNANQVVFFFGEAEDASAVASDRAKVEDVVRLGLGAGLDVYAIGADGHASEVSGFFDF